MQQPDNPDRRKLLKTAAAVSAAAALTACGQGGQSAQTASLPEGKAAADCSGNGSHSQTSYDCYGVHQAGITTPHQPSASSAPSMLPFPIFPSSSTISVP